MNAPRIGVTGAEGVLGRSVREHWPEAEWLPYDGDVRDAEAVQRWVDSSGELDAVLHLAAIVPVDQVRRDPGAAFDVNVRGTWNVMESLREHSPWIFVASSSHVYAAAQLPITEDSRLAPGSVYGLTKMLAEQTAVGYQGLTGARVCIGRIFSFSALTQAQTYLLPSLAFRIRNAERNSTLSVDGGAHVRDFLTTDKIASAIRTLYLHNATGVFNIGSGEGIGVLDVAKRLAARMGREDLEVVTSHVEGTALVADVSRLRALGWTPEGALDELLAAMAGEAAP
jgi:nucleoside-diphosphate-sugar epimerase